MYPTCSKTYANELNYLLQLNINQTKNFNMSLYFFSIKDRQGQEKAKKMNTDKSFKSSGIKSLTSHESF